MAKNTASSEQLYSRAEKIIPGGVNSPVRAYRGVGGTPLFISFAQGAYIYDADDNRYIDYVGSWGPLIFGHAPQFVLEAIEEAMRQGTSFGAPTEREIELAELVRELVPSMELVRFVNSGTEATMSAIRLARAFTQRDFLIKFNGCYHGHADSLLVTAGSGVATLGIPGSPGVPEVVAAKTVSIEFNDLSLLEQTIAKLGATEIAAVIVEPVIGNAGLIMPEEGFLKGLREITARHGIVLIFDEVMTGFRVALGGAQERYKITPDLTTLGKIIGGGLPVGAFGGRREIMQLLAPVGPVYQAGTLSGNPLAMAAGLAQLRKLKTEKPYAFLENLTEKLVTGLRQEAKHHNIPLVTAHCSSMWGLFFSDKPVKNFSSAKQSDVARFKKFFHLMLERGIYLAPSAFEAGFVRTAHTAELIDATVRAAGESFAQLV